MKFKKQDDPIELIRNERDVKKVLRNAGRVDASRGQAFGLGKKGQPVHLDLQQRKKTFESPSLSESFRTRHRPV
jgi:hypothetical protein